MAGVDDLITYKLGELKVGDTVCWTKWSTGHGRTLYSQPLTIKYVGAKFILLSDDSRWTHKGKQYGTQNSGFSGTERTLQRVLDVTAYTLFLRSVEEEQGAMRERNELIQKLQNTILDRSRSLQTVPVENLKRALTLITREGP